MPISLITVNWNGEAILPEYVASVRAQTRAPHEWIVVDNGSEDGSRRMLSEAGATFVALPENEGFCAPNNLGVTRSKGDAVLLLNNDTSFGPGLIETLERALKDHTEFDLFACSMRRWDRPDVMENAGIGYRRTLSGYQLGRGEPASAWSKGREVFGPSGGAALIRRRVIADIGLFDEAFFAYNEDVDFALRARLAGYRCLYVPEAEILHREGTTARRLGGQKLRLIQRNAEWAMRKNVPLALQRRYALLHAAYLLQQAVRNGPNGGQVLAARWEATRHPRPVGAAPRITAEEFGKWLD